MKNKLSRADIKNIHPFYKFVVNFLCNSACTISIHLIYWTHRPVEQTMYVDPPSESCDRPVLASCQLQCTTPSYSVACDRERRRDISALILYSD